MSQTHDHPPAEQPAPADTTPLTFEDVAYLLCSGEIDPPEATLARLTAHLRADPRIAAQVADLDRLTREAGTDLPYEAVRANALLDQLLADDGWQQPAELIEPEVLEVYYPRLIHLAEVRAGRAEDPAPLQALRQRLATAHAELQAGDQLLESVLERMLSLSPDVAERVLTSLASRYRLRREERDGQEARR